MPGFVTYYRDTVRGRERKLIGITPSGPDEKLPRDERSLGRSRYFGGVNLNGDLSSSSIAFDGAVFEADEVLGEDELKQMIADAAAQTGAAAERGAPAAETTA